MSNAKKISKQEFDRLVKIISLNKGGYVIQKKDSGKEVIVHRERAEEILGRRLEPGEEVHHI